jgi:hypothetical protein
MNVTEKMLLLAQKFKDLKSYIETEISALRSIVANVQKQVGPMGPAGPRGQDGRDGRDGIDGLNGRDGSDGINGTNGKDGISVVNASIDFDGSLVLSLSDGTVIDAGVVVAANSRTGDMTVFKSGAVQISKYTATPLAIAGFVEVTDVDGTTRKLAVVE